MKISLCIIVKDEEVNIKECLDRALEVVDEVIVVDTGSTDATVEILKNYKDNNIKIFIQKWNNDFSEARNKSIQHATGDYILILDADERIFCDRKQLEDFLITDNYLAYKLPIYNIFENKEMQVTSEMIRLYKNQNAKYIGAIHEQITFDGEKKVGKIIDSSICRIYHYGYSKKVFEAKNKQKRNMDIIKAEIKRNPKDAFNWYNKGVMEMIAGEYDKALDDFIKSHKLTNNKRMQFHNDLIMKMIQCLLMQKKNSQVIDFIKPLKKDFFINTLPDLYHYMGMAYKELKKYDLAEENFKEAINIGDTSQQNSKFGIGSYMPLIELARIERIRKNEDSAIRRYKEALSHSNNINKYGLEEYSQYLNEIKKEELLNELDSSIEDREENEMKKINQTLDNHKKQFKENIEKLIEINMIEEAENLISEYIKLFKEDVLTYSVMGIISMLKGDNILADAYFKKALAIDNDNIDVLFNLAYLSESQRDYLESYKYYIQLLNISNDSIIEEVINKLESLEQIDEIQTYFYNNETEYNHYKLLIKIKKQLISLKKLNSYNA